MNTSIPNGTADVGAHTDAHLGITALAAHRAQPDMKSTPRAQEPDGQNLAHIAPESSARVSSAASRPNITPATPFRADTQIGTPTGAADTIRAAGSAANWTQSQRLEFIVLWRAIELTMAEIAGHLGLSERHLRRLRTDFGLDTRPALRRLDRAARRHLVAFEAFSPFMPLRGQELLRVAHERRRVQDAARDAAAIAEAARRWWWRRTSPESADAKRLRAMQRRSLRSRL